MIAAQRPLLMFAALLALAAAGCGVKNPEAQFAWRDATLDLIPVAEKAVQKTIIDHFGTPQDIVAWDKLPVNYGGVRGVVAAPAEGVTLKQGQLAVQWSGRTDAIKSGDAVLWLNGPPASEKDPTDTVVFFDAPTGLITLEKHGQAPAGAELAVAFGETMQLGRKVYMKNCHHCHGVAGAGNGPTAKFLNRRPREYRLGIFKFTSTIATSKATRDDLYRIVRNGIPGTYMPSFLLLDDDKGDANLMAVVEYVRWLAMRGEMEKRLDDELTADYSETSINDSYNKAKASAGSGEKVASKSQMTKKAVDEFKAYAASDYPTVVNDTAEMIADTWKQAEDASSVITPGVPRVADTPESRARGRALYLSDKAKCYTCHGPLGRGDGAATEDFWPKPGSTEKYD